MRGIVTTILSVLCATGLTGCMLDSTSLTPPDTTGNRSEVAISTVAYWQQVRAISLTRSKSDDLRELAEVVRKQMEGLRAISPTNVDPDLVQHTEALAAAHERMLATAESAGYTVAALKQSAELRRAFLEAGRQTAEAQTRLKGLRNTLAARYATDFPALDR